MPSFRVSRFQGGSNLAAADSAAPIRKGAGTIRTLFLVYTSIISIPTGLPRQLFRLYFHSQFIDLRGKSSKWGLDKIFTSGQRRGVSEDFREKERARLGAAPLVI